jgi:glycosyltransferase involved in cell wall biosynthesis
LKRIIISVTNDLATDQRVHQVCETLEGFGFDILLIGRKLPNSLPLNRNYKTVRMNLLFNKGFLFYAEYNLLLFSKLLFSKKDILLANDLDTLPSNYLISRLQSKKLIYDSHELFTEVPELINRPKVQNVWLKIEKSILPKLKNCYTVCQSIADYYNDKYSTNFKVIKNLPVISEFSETKLENNEIKTIIYQGALNLGRGIELMIESMQYLESTQFIIVGDGDITSELKQQVEELKLQNKVRFLGKKSPEELKKITLQADLGLSLEEDLGLNYRYALPNKIFDYIHAEIPILVSDLPEMKRVIKEYSVGEIIMDRESKQIAEQIQNILKTDYKEALINAKKELNWSTEKEKLKTIFQPFI